MPVQAPIRLSLFLGEDGGSSELDCMAMFHRELCTWSSKAS